MISNIASLGLFRAVILFICLLVSVSVHECAHALVAYWRGDETAKYYGRITLNPVAHFEPIGFLMMLFTNFGWGKPVPVNPNNLINRKQDSLLVSIAGPISNLLLAILAVVLLRLIVFVPLQTSVLENSFFILTSFIEINVGLAIFNLLPIPPLDGSNIIRPFLPYDIEEKIDIFTRQYGLIAFIFLFFPLPFFGNQSLISFVIGPIITTVTSFFLSIINL